MRRVNRGAKKLKRSHLLNVVTEWKRVTEINPLWHKLWAKLLLEEGASETRGKEDKRQLAPPSAVKIKNRLSGIHNQDPKIIKCENEEEQHAD